MLAQTTFFSTYSATQRTSKKWAFLNGLLSLESNPKPELETWNSYVSLSMQANQKGGGFGGFLLASAAVGYFFAKLCPK